MFNLDDCIIYLIQKKPFFAHLVMGMRKEFSTRVPTAGVSVTDKVNLVINPDFFRTLTAVEQAAILEHECIYQDVLVDTDHGKLTIKEIVEKELQVKALSVSPEGKLEYKKIIGYSKKPMTVDSGKHWVSVKYTSNNFLYSTVKCTNDHRIAVVKNPLNPVVEYVKAEDSTNLYSARRVNTKRILNKERPAYNAQQVEVVIGLLLGDSHISSAGVLTSVGSQKHVGYITHKQSVLDGKIVRGWSGFNKDLTTLRLVHGLNEQTKYLRQLFYENGKRTVKNILPYITPLSVAYWFMDDGSWTGYGNSFLHTEGLSEEDNHILKEVFASKFNIECEVNKRSGRDLFCLKFKKEATDKLFNLIAKHIHPSMQYKIPQHLHSQYKFTVNTTPLGYSLKKITEVKKLTVSYSALYDITVEDNHNFFANNTLVHNCLHVVFNHFKRREHRKHRIYNMAADLAINDYITDLPKKVKLLSKEGKPVLGKDGKPAEGKILFPKDHGLPQWQTSEFYYEELMKKKDQAEKEKDYQAGEDTIDDHGTWGESIDNDEVIDEKIKSLVKPAMEAAKKAGQMSSNLEKAVSELFNKPKDWRQDLQKFTAKMTEVVGEPSRKVRNRRYGIIFPGYKKEPKLRIAVAVDTSGSVPDDALDQFMAEIGKIEKQGAEVWIIESDASVQDCYKFDPRRKIKFKGRGGTTFQPALEKGKELNIDGLIYMTDGDDWGGEAKRPSYPVMWALLPGCKVKYPWGFKTTIEVRKK